MVFKIFAFHQQFAAGVGDALRNIAPLGRVHELRERPLRNVLFCIEVCNFLSDAFVFFGSFFGGFGVAVYFQQSGVLPIAEQLGSLFFGKALQLFLRDGPALQAIYFLACNVDQLLAERLPQFIRYAHY